MNLGKTHKPGCMANISCCVDHGGRPCPGPYGTCTCDTPKTPPVNSRKDTGTRGEECDCVCGDCKGRKHFNYKDVKCINYQSPLADTERCKDCGGPGHSTCGFRADRVGGEEKPRCSSHPKCSHNTNGRDLDKPCSISFPPPSKQSEECYVDSRTPEEKANEPSATVTSAGGPMTVALTPPKAEGSTVSQDQTVKESLTVTPQHISKMETTKAEGVGEEPVKYTMDWSNKKKATCKLCQKADPGRIWCRRHAPRQVTTYETYIPKKEHERLLTSATRVAEERKDGEIRGIVDAAHKLSKVLWDTMPFFTKEVGDADLELRRLLPPPPDKPTQP